MMATRNIASATSVPSAPAASAATPFAVRSGKLSAALLRGLDLAESRATPRLRRGYHHTSCCSSALLGLGSKQESCAHDGDKEHRQRDERPKGTRRQRGDPVRHLVRVPRID